MFGRLLTTIAIAVLALGVAPPATAEVDTGRADFTRFAALGDSLVAGECNASLVVTFQDTSPPALIYRQVNGTDAGFEQPLISEPGNPARLILGPGLTPVPISTSSGVPLNADPSRPFNNMGISGGARVNDLLTISGEASCLMHPLAAFKNCPRMNLTLQDRGTALSQVLEQDPTFVLLWVGGDDALQAAEGGTVIEGVTLTPTASFESDYRAVVDTIVGAGADIAFATVPNVAVIPFVNAIPPVVVDPVTREPVLVGGQPVPLFDSTGNLSPADRLTLFASTYLAAGCGIPDTIDGGFDPGVCADGALPDDVVLTAAEAAQISERIDEYNDVIRTVAQETGAALFDANAFLLDILDHGLQVSGIEYTLDYLTGGIIGFDGVHPTPFTQAVIANGFIKAINRKFDGHIPLVNLTPFMFGPDGNVGPTAGTARALPSPEGLGRIRANLGLPNPTRGRIWKNKTEPADEAASQTADAPQPKPRPLRRGARR